MPLEKKNEKTKTPVPQKLAEIIPTQHHRYHPAKTVLMHSEKAGHSRKRIAISMYLCSYFASLPVLIAHFFPHPHPHPFNILFPHPIRCFEDVHGMYIYHEAT